MHTISSNHYSHDMQVVDALNYLRGAHIEAYSEIRRVFTEDIVWEGFGGSHLDTDAMGVDAEWSSWLTDAIEDTGLVIWEDGEPWAITGDEVDCMDCGTTFTPDGDDELCPACWQMRSTMRACMKATRS